MPSHCFLSWSGSVASDSIAVAARSSWAIADSVYFRTVRGRNFPPKVANSPTMLTLNTNILPSKLLFHPQNYYPRINTDCWVASSSSLVINTSKFIDSVIVNCHCQLSLSAEWLLSCIKQQLSYHYQPSHCYYQLSLSGYWVATSSNLLLPAESLWDVIVSKVVELLQAVS